jgi:hypothetical protein
MEQKTRVFSQIDFQEFILQKAHQAMLVAQMKSVAARSALSLSVASPSPPPPPPSPSPQQAAAAPAAPAHHMQDKSKIPSPAGTGNYRIYG